VVSVVEPKVAVVEEAPKQIEEASKPVVDTRSASVSPAATPERRPDPIRVRAKGLLERRGSNVSLTIDLPQAGGAEGPTHVITPTREW